MSTIINGSSPSITFSDSTTQSTAFTGQALAASPYTTALGAGSLAGNTGTANTAIGNGALASNTTASNNTAVGYQAGYSGTTAGNNTYLGNVAGYSNSTGFSNTLIGYQAGNSLASSNNNVAVGRSALQSYTGTTGNNTMVGTSAGFAITTGEQNTIIGSFNGNQNGLDIRTASNYIVLSDGAGNPRLVSDNNGYVFVNATSAVSTSQFGVNTAASINTAALNNSNASPYGLFVNFTATPNNTSNVFIQCNDGSGQKFLVFSNGNVVNSNNSYGAISDEKLKENIVDTTPKLADLMNIKVRNYNLKSDPDHKQIGVVAQELQEVFPGLVSSSPDKDEEGNDLGTETLSVKYSVLVPILIKSVQEQQAIIESLTTRIAALEAK